MIYERNGFRFLGKSTSSVAAAVVAVVVASIKLFKVFVYFARRTFASNYAAAVCLHVCFMPRTPLCQTLFTPT